jgi:CheY-like chemotaxis protein
MIVDDDDEVRMTAGEMLEYIGFTVVACGTRGEAERLLREADAAGDPVRLALVDLTIRGGTGGPDLLAALRLVRPDLPAIVTSGHLGHAVLRDFHGFGFSGALEKRSRSAGSGVRAR